MLKKLIFFIVLSLLQSCASIITINKNHQTPSVANEFKGIAVVDLWGNQSDVMPYANSACGKYGGVKAGSLVEVDRPRGLGPDLRFWAYECNGPSLPRNDLRGAPLPEVPKPSPKAPTQKAPSSSKVFTVEEAKEKCSSLGFKPGTERFSECALELVQ